jgi:ATP-dependent Lon protease
VSGAGEKPQETPSVTPSSVASETGPSDPTAEVSESDRRKEVTTQERKPLVVPSTVHVRITPETLKDYVGPPVYQRDRIYAESSRPPPGVSTGLGYLGNGSGAVMPVEAMARYII